MFQVGDLVFCPMRGSGVIEAIEKRSMLNQTQEYFIIHLQVSGMTVMVPTDRIATSRFRPISDSCAADIVLTMLKDKNVIIDTTIPVKQRIKNNQTKLSSGSLEEHGEIIRDLTYIQQTKPLNAGERSLLMDARKFFSDELSMIKSITTEQASSMLDQLLS